MKAWIAYFPGPPLRTEISPITVPNNPVSAAMAGWDQLLVERDELRALLRRELDAIGSSAARSVIL
jgi:hypothetical protein